MKFIKWKILIVTCLVCLLPILLGLALWDSLPDTIAVHFDINNNPDNFASKGFAVFGMPILMVVLQCFCCFVNDINSKKFGPRIKFERVTKWIIPIMSVVLQTTILCYGLGKQIDMRAVAAVIVGGVLLVIGNYLPKFDYIKNYNLEVEKTRKINRFLGFETVIMGALFIISVFLPPPFTVGCIFLLIPYAIIGAVYGVCVTKSKGAEK